MQDSRSIITFNPPDVREIQRHLADQGVQADLRHEMAGTQDPEQGAPAPDEGPAHLTLTDPDGNVLLFDQF